MRHRHSIFVFVLALLAAVPTAWLLVGDSGLGTMLAVIVLAVGFRALFAAVWRRWTDQK